MWGDAGQGSSKGGGMWGYHLLIRTFLTRDDPAKTNAEPNIKKSRTSRRYHNTSFVTNSWSFGPISTILLVSKICLNAFCSSSHKFIEDRATSFYCHRYILSHPAKTLDLTSPHQEHPRSLNPPTLLSLVQS